MTGLHYLKTIDIHWRNNGVLVLLTDSLEMKKGMWRECDEYEYIAKMLKLKRISRVDKTKRLV